MYLLFLYITYLTYLFAYLSIFNSYLFVYFDTFIY